MATDRNGDRFFDALLGAPRSRRRPTPAARRHEARPPVHDPAALFDAMVFGGEDLVEDRHGTWTVIARPGELLDKVGPSDLLIQRARGDGRLAIVSRLVEAAPHAHGSDALVEDLWPHPVTSPPRRRVRRGAEGGRLGPDTIVVRRGRGFFAEDAGATEQDTVTFPSGLELPVVSGPDGPSERYYDPTGSGNPLLDSGPAFRNQRISTSFTVGELATHRGTVSPKARIDPKLVELLQEVRDWMGTPIEVVEGYRSFAQHQARGQGAPDGHLSGKAARIRARGAKGPSLAKAVLSTRNCWVHLEVHGDEVDIELGDEFRLHVPGRGARAQRIRKALWTHHLLWCKLPKPIRDTIREARDEDDGFKWNNAVRMAVHLGVRDENALTDWIFEAQHRLGRRIRKGETSEIETWKSEREAVRAVLAEPRPPSASVTSVTCTNERQLDLADADADLSAADFLGRYEIRAVDPPTQATYSRMFVAINPAGEHVEVVMTAALYPVTSQDTTRIAMRWHGDLQHDGSLLLFDRKQPDRRATISRRSSSTLLLTLTPSLLGSGAKVLHRTERRPTLMDAAIDLMPSENALVARNEWFPLAIDQLQWLEQKLTPAAIIPLLKDWLGKPKGSRVHEKIGVKKSAGRLRRYINEVFRDPRGIHRADLDLGRYAARRLLLSHRYLHGSVDRSLLDWIHVILSATHHIDSSAPSKFTNLGLVADGGTTQATKAPDHEYTVELELSEGFFGIFGAAKGKITIEKTGGTPWAGGKQTWSIWFGELGVGAKLSVKGKISGKAVSHMYWAPNEIPGRVELVRGGLSIGGGPASASATAGFLHIFGSGTYPPLQVLLTKKGISPKSGTGFSAKLGLSGAMGKISSKSLPKFIVPATPQKTDYTVRYDTSSTVHFCFASALLTPAGRQAVRVMCAHELAALTSADSEMKILGHADRVDTPSFNLALAAARAQNARQAIEDVMGSRLAIPDDKIVVRGKGETAAARGGRPDMRRDPRDRRVEIFVNGRIVLTL